MWQKRKQPERKTVKKRAEATKNAKKPKLVHQTKLSEKTVERKLVEITRITRSAKKPQLSNGKNDQEQNGKRRAGTMKISRNSRQPALTNRPRRQKQAPKRLPGTKTVRNSKKPRLPSSRRSLPRITFTRSRSRRTGDCRESEKPTSDTSPEASRFEDRRVSPAPLSPPTLSLVSRFEPSEDDRPVASSPPTLSLASVPETSENGRRLPPGTLLSNTTSLVPDESYMRPSTAVSCASIVTKLPEDSRDINQTGFDRNLEPFKIVHMAEVREQLYFMMMWKDSRMMDLVPVKAAKERCPQLVIQFYESHLINVFSSSTN